MCRNPLYLFSAIGAAGLGLATETLVVPLAVILVFAVFYPIVIRSEERRLLAIHGERFAAYASSTSCFLPRFNRFQEPDTYRIPPTRFRRSMFGALWFVWLIGVLELAESLREAGLIPTLLHLH